MTIGEEMALEYLLVVIALITASGFVLAVAFA